MADPERARRYLASRVHNLKAASLAVGKNHAYLQQYIKTGKPRWLPEAVRDGLVERYGLDANRLRPPPAGSRPHGGSGGQGQDQTKVNPPGNGQLADDPRTVELMEVWATIPPDRRDLALRILHGFADEGGSAVAV